jgi:hypothetical protein
MERSNNLPRLLQMLIQPLSLFESFYKVDLGKPSIISGSYLRVWTVLTG